MTDYSSDSSTASNESVASYVEQAMSELGEDMRLRTLEESIDVVMKNYDNTLKYPFYLFQDPVVAIDYGMNGRASNKDVLDRLSTKEQMIWTSLWGDDDIYVESDACLDTDALDALIEVGFRAAGGTQGNVAIVYSVVCALLDARKRRSNPSAPRII